MWNEFEYIIAYLDKDAMGVKYVRTDKAHLGEMIEKIVENSAVNIRVWREEVKV